MKLNRKLRQSCWLEVKHFVLDDSLGWWPLRLLLSILTSMSVARYIPFLLPKVHYLTEVSEVPLDGLEGHKALSPGHRPGLMRSVARAPCKGKSIKRHGKAYALSGRILRLSAYPGRCPGLCADGLSGRFYAWVSLLPKLQ